MNKLILSVIMVAVLALPAAARNFAFPKNDPAFTTVIPDSWKTEEIDYGFSAISPGEDVFISFEYARGKQVDGLLKNNDEWMKESSIKRAKTPEELEVDFNGLRGTAYIHRTTDQNGPTIVEFVVIPGKNDRVMLLTTWASVQEREKHKDAIRSIIASIKPIN